MLAERTAKVSAESVRFLGVTSDRTARAALKRRPDLSVRVTARTAAGMKRATLTLRIRR